MNHDYKLSVVLNTSYKPLRFRVEGKKHYQMILGIHSENDPDLKQVQFVNYLLHPSFKDRLKSSSDRGNKFQIEILAWGTFEVGVKVGLKNDEAYEFAQSMSDVMKKESF